MSTPTPETAQAPARKLEIGRVGESVRRIDAIPKVAGEFAYASDLFAADMLWGHTVRSPHAHALIRAIDTTQRGRDARRPRGAHARGRPGREALRPRVPPTSRCSRSTASATSASRSRSSPPSTPSRRAARPRRSGSSTSRSSRSSIPRRATEREPIHPERWTRRPRLPRRPAARTSSARSSSATATPTREGDVVGRGHLRARHPGPGLPRPRVRAWPCPDGEGGVDIYVATQWLHVDRDQVAPCLGLTPNRVRIHLAGVGGAFGGREDLSMQIHGAMLALHTNRPVKFVYNREESFVGHIHRHPARIWMEHRADRDGRLVVRPREDPARRRRLRLELDRGHLERRLVRLRPVRRPERAHRGRRASTRTTRRAAPCAASAPCSPASRTRRRWTSSRTRSASAASTSALRNALGPGDVLPTGQVVTGSLPVAEVIRRCADDPGSGSRGAAARSRSACPGGAGNTTRGEGVRRGVGFARRLQEHLLLGGLRRLLRRPRPPLRRRRRRAGRRGLLGRRRGRPGRRQRHGPGRAHGARRRERRRRAALDRGASRRPARRRPRARPG